VRIVMTTDSVGGVWAYTMELCKALGARGYVIELACMGGKPGPAERDEALRLPNVTLHESDYRLEWMEDPWEDLERAAAWVESLRRESRADLLHLNCYGPALRDHDVPVLLVTHSCVHSWWRATRGSDPDAGWARYRECVIRALESADSIIAPTTASLAATRDCYPEVEVAGRSAIVYNGIDANPWSEVREPGSPFVLGVGRVWDEGKNLGQLAAIAPDLACPVLIAGAGAPEEQDDTANVVRLGPMPRSRLASFYRRAAVFAHPARYEPFGLAVLEAALSGCPLVLGDIPSLRELWGDVALFAAPDDRAAWRDAIGGLLANPAERRRRGRAARAHALRYSATAMATAYSAHYRRLVELPARGVA
jgi:glycogen synthase